MAKGKFSGSRRTFRLNNMTGLMNTMSEANAYTTFDPNANFGSGLTQIPFEFQLVENWQPINRGGMSTTTGFTMCNSGPATSKITGLYRYFKSIDGSNYYIFSQGTKVYKLGQWIDTPVDIGVTVADGKYTHFTTAQDKLIICDGNGAPQKWDGFTASNLAGTTDASTAFGFKQAVYYQNRIFAFSATHDQSLLYFSAAGDITTGYSSNFVNCDVNDGQKITCIGLFFVPGQLEPMIVVGKERSIGIVTGSGATSDPYTFTKISFDLGIPGFRQYVQFEQDAAFLTPRGISSYQTAIKNINIEQTLLSGKVTNQFTKLALSSLPDALSWFDWKNRRVSYAVCSGNSQVPDTIWHYDIDLQGMYKQTGFTVTAAFVDTDGTVFTGDAQGKIYQHNASDHNYAGQIISATLQTPALDFFEPDYYKRILHAKITARGNGNGNYTLGVSTLINHGLVVGSSHTIPITSGQYIWGGATWTEDPHEYQWGSAPLKESKFFPSNMFQNISFTFTQSGLNQPVDLLEMVLEVEYLDLV